jgi:hypothetical protein
MGVTFDSGAKAFTLELEKTGRKGPTFIFRTSAPRRRTSVQPRVWAQNSMFASFGNSLLGLCVQRVAVGWDRTWPS